MVKYQLWDMVSYSHGEPLVPFSMVKESDRFEYIYTEFNKVYQRDAGDYNNKVKINK